MILSFINRLFGIFNKEVHHEGDRSAMQKNFSKKDDVKKPDNDFIERKKQSMQDSQGTSDFSGSGYNGPGNVDREKRNSNMSQRNF